MVGEYNLLIQMENLLLQTTDHSGAIKKRTNNVLAFLSQYDTLYI